jgi:hypothetical protein
VSHHPEPPSPARPRDVSTLTSPELQRTRRELAAALALARPGSPVQLPIRAHIDASTANWPAEPPCQS